MVGCKARLIECRALSVEYRALLSVEYRALLSVEYRALLIGYKNFLIQFEPVQQGVILLRKRAISMVDCMAILIVYRAFSVGYRARLIEYRALLMEYRALLMEYRALLLELQPV